jgi:hypothetical protein
MYSVSHGVNVDDKNGKILTKNEKKFKNGEKRPKMEEKRQKNRAPAYAWRP